MDQVAVAKGQICCAPLGFNELRGAESAVLFLHGKRLTWPGWEMENDVEHC